MFAKLMYDVGPELLCAILKLTPGGFAGFALDVAIIVLKEMITWDVLVDALGIGEELRTGKNEDQKNAAEAGKITADINKDEKNTKYDSDSKEKKEADAADKARRMGFQDGSEYGGLNSAANRSTANGGAYNGYGGGSDRSSTYGGFGGSGSTNNSGNSSGNNYDTVAGPTGPAPSVKMSDDKGNSIETGEGWVKYIRSDGTAYVKKGGSLAWRTNNPGNIMWLGNGAYVRKLGAIGYYQNKNGKYAVFPSEEDGWNAMHTLLFVHNNSQHYKDTIASEVFRKYAPTGHGANDPNWYANEVVKKVGSNKILKQYNAEERKRFMAAIRQVEGWKVGTIDGNMKAGSEINTSTDATSTANTTTSTAKTDAAKTKNPAGLLESDIATPSGKSGYTGTNTKAPKGATESDIPTSSGKSSTQKSTGGSDRGSSAANTYGSVAKSSSVQVTNNTINTPQDGIANAIAKMSSSQTAAIVGALNGLATLLQNILKELSNNNTEAMRQAAAGAK